MAVLKAVGCRGFGLLGVVMQLAAVAPENGLDGAEVETLALSRQQAAQLACPPPRGEVVVQLRHCLPQVRVRFDVGCLEGHLELGVLFRLRFEALMPNSANASFLAFVI